MDGFIIVHKPKDFTSHDVVNVIRRHFRKQKVGHTGTLDPGATGVLPVCVGKATKLQDQMMAMAKTYRCDLVFGLDSDTLDRDGDVTATDPGFSLDGGGLREVLASFQGEIEQVPPMVSAVKIAGVPLYKLARKGEEVERKPRRVTVYGIEVLALKEAAPFPTATVAITCSKGTYVRALAKDIAAKLGTTAIVDHLVRTATGPFRLDQALSLETIAERAENGDFSFLLPLRAAVPEMPVVTVGDIAEIRAVLAGNLLPGYGDLAAEQTYFLEDPAHDPLALAHFIPGLGLKPYKILREREEEREPKAGFLLVDTEGTGDAAIALGNFDGVHRGHQLLIRAMRQSAEKKGLASLVLTFDPHPKQFFRPEGDCFTLQQKADKAVQVARLGVDGLCFYPFDAALSQMTPEDFLAEVLIRRFHAKEIFVGYDFKFGRGGAGNGPWLREEAARQGIAVHIVEQVAYRGEAVSSSRIKAALTAGDVGFANFLLGYRFLLRGRVVAGKRLGRTLGFPTANLAVPPRQFVPGPGVYAFWVETEAGIFPGVGNIGSRPTLGENLPPTVEAHLIDADLDLYGREIALAFVAKIRDEQKFPDLEALKAQIECDKEKALEILPPLIVNGIDV